MKGGRGVIAVGEKRGSWFVLVSRLCLSNFAWAKGHGRLSGRVTLKIESIQEYLPASFLAGGQSIDLFVLQDIIHVVAARLGVRRMGEGDSA